jgi:S-adenosylmethionine decarboxylase
VALDIDVSTSSERRMKQTSALGIHIIAELDGCAVMPDKDALATLLSSAALGGHAQLLNVHVHEFGDGAGVAGVALLAESHISVHTWPEFQYAAVDVFMCGMAANPEAALEILVTGMQASHVRVEKLRRDSQLPENFPPARPKI